MRAKRATNARVNERPSSRSWRIGLSIACACLILGALAWTFAPIADRSEFSSQRVAECERSNAVEPTSRCGDLERLAALCDGGAPVCARASDPSTRRELCVDVHRYMASVEDGPSVSPKEMTAAWCSEADERDGLCPSGAGRHDNPFAFSNGCEWVGADGAVDAHRSGFDGAWLVGVRAVFALGVVIVLVLIPAVVFERRRAARLEVGPIRADGANADQHQGRSTEAPEE